MFLPLAFVALTLTFPLTFAIDPITTLECHRRQYSYKVQQTDSNGHLCWDQVNVMSCWGRCDSNEIADWKFPYKRSHHPVCLHDTTQEKRVILKHCDADADPEIREYKFQEAATCSCSYCKSSQASCEGLRYRGARRSPDGQSKKNVKRNLLLERADFPKERLKELKDLSLMEANNNFSLEKFKQLLQHLRDIDDEARVSRVSYGRPPSDSNFGQRQMKDETYPETDVTADLLKVSYYDPESFASSDSVPWSVKRILSQLPKRDPEYFEPGGENDQ